MVQQPSAPQPADLAVMARRAYESDIPGRYLVPSYTDPMAVYAVDTRPDTGLYECECPHHQHRVVDCVHIQEVQWIVGERQCCSTDPRALARWSVTCDHRPTGPFTTDTPVNSPSAVDTWRQPDAG